MERKVSIIVPVYKSEKYLNKLIDSILNQTYKNIELILIDDESPDNSGKICDDYASNDKRVIVIHQKNSGTCGARNTGLEIMTGDYLTFADGDDWMENDCIEYLVSILENNSCDMSMTDSIFTTRDRIQNKNDNIKVFNSEEATCAILYDIIPVGPWNKLYKTSVIKKNNLNFSVAWFGEGLYFSVMSAQHSKSIAVGHRKIYNYRLNNPNSGTTIMKVENGISALNNIIYINKNLIVNTNKTRAAANWHIWQNNYNLLKYIIANNEVDKYKEKYIDSRMNIIKMFPNILFKAKISLKAKMIILLKAVFPNYFIKRSINKKNKEFNKDNMD